MSRLRVCCLVLFFSAAIAVSVVDEDAGSDPIIEQVVSESYSDDDLTLGAEAHFANFMAQYGKRYKDADEHARRFQVFKFNLRRARRHQMLDPTAEHGITKFSDLTPAEFRKQFLGIRRSSASLRRELLNSAPNAPVLPTDNLPDNFDWRDHGAVSGVKDQGTCGSCWSFSTSGALEGAHFLATGKLVSLSEQQLVDCDHECDPSQTDACDAGCNGGLMTTAFGYLTKSGGLERESDYPYTGIDRGVCKIDKSKIVASVKNYSIVSVDEGQIAANLVKNGPLAVGINAAYMQTYIGGVSCPYICLHHLNHGVLLVGYGEAGFAPSRFKEKPYWIIKNSWGENWGERGYYKICRGHNMCGINTMVSTVTADKTPHKV